MAQDKAALPPKHWFLAEAVSWLAFGEALTVVDLVAEHRDFMKRWRNDPQGWLARLPYPDDTPKALVNGYEPPTERQVAEELKREILGAAAADVGFDALRARLVEEIQEREARNSAYEEAQGYLLQALRAGVVEAEGCLSDQLIPVAIKASAWSGSVEIKQDRLLENGAAIFQKVQVLREQVVAWQEGHSAAPPSAAVQPCSGDSDTQKSKGGRPPKFAWEELNKSIIMEAIEGDLSSRRKIREFARAWLDSKYGDAAPDESTLREHLAKHTYPSSLA